MGQRVAGSGVGPVCSARGLLSRSTSVFTSNVAARCANMVLDNADLGSWDPSGKMMGCGRRARADPVGPQRSSEPHSVGGVWRMRLDYGRGRGDDRRPCGARPPRPRDGPRRSASSKSQVPGRDDARAGVAARWTTTTACSTWPRQLTPRGCCSSLDRS